MLKRLIRDELSEIKGFDGNRVKLLFPEHHLSHAASAWEGFHHIHRRYLDEVLRG
jgi:predicted NodU family carbamoyl transferase